MRLAAREHRDVSWDLGEDEARELVLEYLAAQAPPGDADRPDEWIITKVVEHEWGWVFSWNNRRAFEGSREARDLYAGGGPYLVDRRTGAVAMAGSGQSVEHYIDLWRRGQLPNKPRPT